MGTLAERVRAGLRWRWGVALERVPPALRNRVEGWLPHNLVYSDRYFAALEGEAQRSAAAMAAAMREAFHPEFCLDVGCGTGALLSEFKRQGVPSVAGLEYAEAAIAACRSRGLDVRKFDLEAASEVPDLSRPDLVTSFEVAEHLPAATATAFVRLLTRYGAPVVLTAAPPGQGGTDHVNEQPQSYWIAKMSAVGFAHDPERSTRFARLWESSGVTPWYWKNVMVFLPAVAQAPSAQ